jgi:3-keto-disaccharide hydrolase
MRHPRIILAALVSLALLTRLDAALAADTPVAGPDDPDFKIQGEYTGTIKSPDGDSDVGVQVIALGGGKFHAVGYPGGLPGDGWDGNSKHEADGELKDGVVRFEGDGSHGEIKDGELRIVSPTNDVIGKLKKVERKSPTLGAKPPQGAVVLFDGTSADAFSPGKMTADGLLMAGATSKQKFQSCQLHVEFLLPFMPKARGQARANSGCYAQGRYEVQMLDSFGLKGENNECGGIYSIKAPDVNMCYPPLSWQTYDIDYTAAKFDGDKKVKNGTMTVKHNGVLIHKDVELPKITTAAPNPEGPDPKGIYLQDHGNPVRYRNIWLVEKP